jgi:hypothetical protein
VHGVGRKAHAPQPNDYLIDQDYGFIVLFMSMPGPDSHWFRINQAGYQSMETLTICYVNGSWACPGTQTSTCQ